jgi:hypothetical protein
MQQQLDRIQVKNLKINRGQSDVPPNQQQQPLNTSSQSTSGGRGHKLKIKVAKDQIQKR